jgi:hypothetical protein
MNSDVKPGVFVSVGLAIVLLSFALTVDFPRAAGGGFKGDEATYYVLGHSLAHDFDFAFTHDDLVRVWQEYPGPEGIFLKHGKSIDIQRTAGFPFLRWVKLEDPQRDTRLFFSKSFIYPLVAAPFIFLFGTNGFLVLHALLIALDFLVAYLFLHARTKSNWAAVPLALVFLAASVVPVYFVWLMPELFNFSLAMYALFFWSYKEVAGRGTERSDYIAAALLGVLTFSKPTHALLMFPVVALALSRHQWRRSVKTALAWALVTGALFAANAAITGEFNYQGGDRKTFYHTTGFPFANGWETFDNSGPVRGREDVMVGDVLVNNHSLSVFLHDIVYFIAGRNAGLVPYFFPGVLALVLFAMSKGKPAWQWLVAATAVAAVFMHILLWPFTYNGGGGPVGNRYFLAFYPLFLFLMPATAGLGAAFTSLIVGALFTSTAVLNPFHASANPGDHAKSGPLRLLPIDLTLLHDLPVAQHPDRMKQPLGGSPPVLAYFLDDAVYNPEGDWFWVKGKSKADVVLRAPVAEAGKGKYISKQISTLTVDVRNAGVPNRIKVTAGGHTQTLDMGAGELRQISFALGGGVPFHRDPQPTSYLYVLSISTSNGLVPFLEPPCQTRGACTSGDARYLGAMIHVVPEYTDAEVSTWTP